MKYIDYREIKRPFFVFLAGTFTTLKLKAALKDVARVHRVPHGTVNYITAMLDDGTDWTESVK